METNFILAIVLFFVALVASGILGHYLKVKLPKKKKILIGSFSAAIGIALIFPTLRTNGNVQIVLTMFIVAFANFALILILPEKELPHSIEDNITKGKKE